MPKFFTKALERMMKSVNIPFSDKISMRYGSGYSSYSPKKNGVKEYKNWVYACVKARANALANIEFILTKNGEKVESHAILDLLAGVNPNMTGKELGRATQSFLDLEGNAFWFLSREENAGKEVKQIYLIHPSKMSIVPSTADNPLLVAGYIYKDGESKIPLNADEVIHFKNFNPNANYPYPQRGMSIVEAAAWAIDTDNEIRNWNINFFKNGARPDGVLEVGGEGSISAEDYKRLSAQWDEEHRGTNNSHKTAILAGGMQWKQISMPQSELEFAKQKEMNRDEIIALFNVPKTILGLTEDVNRATAEASLYIFNKLVVDELMQSMVDTLNESLVRLFDEEGLKLSYTSPVPADRQQIIAEYSAGINNWLSRNDIRMREGLPPTENGDEFLASAMLVPIDEVAPQKMANTPKVKEIKTPDSIIKSFLNKKEMEQTKSQRRMTTEQKSAYATIWKATLKAGRDPLKKELKKYFEAQELEVIKNLKKEMGEKALSDVFDMDKSVSLGISLITPFIREYLNQAGKNTGEVTGQTFDKEDPAIKKFTEKRAELFAKEINTTTKDKVLETVKAGREAGKTIDEISDDVADIYSIAKGSRSNMIARTEASASANEGSKIAYIQAGIEKWEWMVVDPNDEDCKGNEGVIVNIGDEFPDGSVQPPDPHPNCECTTLAVFED